MTDYNKLVEALRECARADADCRNNCPYYNHDVCTDDLKSDAADAIEALQAQLPKRGKWIKRHEFVEDVRFDGFRCSICNWWKGDFETYNYCPKCGAKMEVQDGQ